MSYSSIGDFATQTQNAAGSAAAGSTPNAASTGDTGQLGQNEFLQLMVAQLKNQNPTQPTDPTQFVTQLAQFSQVTGIENMQTSMSSLVTQMRASQAMSGTSLVGHQILAPGASITTDTAGAAVTGAADVPADTTALQVQVQDSSGQTIRVFGVNPQQGLQKFTWDGKDNSGAAAAAGTYTLKVVAATDGTATSLDPLVQSTVSSVTIDPTTQDLSLNTNAGAVDLSTVRQVL